MASWRKDYNGSVKPDADGFQLTSGDDTTKANVRTYFDSSWLEYKDTGGVGVNCRYEATANTATPWNPTNATGWTLFVRAQVGVNEFTVDIDDGVFREILLLQTGLVQLKATTSSQDLRRPREIRVTGVGSTWKVFIDESDTPIITITAAVASSAKLLRFGINSGDVNAQIFLRELAFSVDGSHLASTLPAPSLVTTYATVQEVRNFINIPADGLADATIAEIVRRVEADIDEIMFGSNYTRTLRAFGAGGTETDEVQNFQGGVLFRLRYPFITAISAVAFRTAVNTFSTLLNSDLTGWFSSARDMETGVIRIAPRLLRRSATIRVTYTWGLATPPAAIRELAILKSALYCYNAALQHGAPDVFEERRESLEAIIEKKTGYIRDGWKAWKVLG